MARFPLSSTTWAATFLSSLALVGTLIPAVRAQVEGVPTTESIPALFTGDFGDCMGGQSLINLTSFDAAYYNTNDDMFVLFNIAGLSNLRNESVMRKYWLSTLLALLANYISSIHFCRSL